MSDAFRENYLVFGLKAEAIDELRALAKDELFLAQEFLCRKGERSSDLFVILEGKVLVCTPKGDRLAEIGPGSVLGEVALVDDQPRSADAVCLGKVRVARFPAGALRKYMGQNSAVGFTMLANLSRVMSMRLRQTDTALEILASSPRDSWAGSL